MNSAIGSRSLNVILRFITPLKPVGQTKNKHYQMTNSGKQRNEILQRVELNYKPSSELFVLGVYVDAPAAVYQLQCLPSQFVLK